MAPESLVLMGISGVKYIYCSNYKYQERALRGRIDALHNSAQEVIKMKCGYENSDDDGYTSECTVTRDTENLEEYEELWNSAFDSDAEGRYGGDF